MTSTGFCKFPIPELVPMWDAVGDFLLKYGPFPSGIVVGMWLTKWAISKQLMYMDKEKMALRNEKKELMEYIKAQEKRIDQLHERLSSEEP